MNANLLVNCLAALDKRLNKHIDTNFGRCPNEPWFDAILAKRISLLETLLKVDQATWRQYNVLCFFDGNPLILPRPTIFDDIPEYGDADVVRGCPDGG